MFVLTVAVDKKTPNLAEKPFREIYNIAKIVIVVLLILLITFRS